METLEWAPSSYPGTDARDGYGALDRSFDPSTATSWMSDGGPENAPPLLEELGIDFDRIKSLTISVLTAGVRLPKMSGHHGHAHHGRPHGDTDDKADFLVSSDMAGPLLYCLLFGTVLLLSGNNHFGYVYGFGAFGSMAIHWLLNLMSTEGITLYRCISVMGYSLVPMIFLAAVRIFISLNGWSGALLGGVSILWCSFAASNLFVTGLKMHDQTPLVMYPLALFYTAFGLLAIF